MVLVEAAGQTRRLLDLQEAPFRLPLALYDNLENLNFLLIIPGAIAHLT